MVLLVLTGEIVDQDMYEMLAEATRLLNEHHSILALVDCSEAAAAVSLAGIYGLPDKATALGAPWNLREAVVLPRTRLRLETYQFLALVSRNAGYDVRLLDDRKAAEEWLLAPSPIPAGTPHVAST